MKHFIIIIAIFVQTTIIAQTRNQDKELETLEKLYEQQKEDEKEEIESQQKIFQFKNDTNETIQANISNITNDDYNKLINYKTSLWNQIVERQKFYNSSRKFLSSEYSLLNSYKENIINRLNQYISNNKIKSTKNSDSVNNNVDLNKCIVEYNKLVKYAKELKDSNELLTSQNQYLKGNNADLIKSSKKLVELTSRGAENLEKSLKSLKEKDEKIEQLRDEILEIQKQFLDYIKKHEKEVEEK